jgi:hypothetical protein
MGLRVRVLAEGEVLRYKARTELPLGFLLSHAGISQRTWHEWAGRRGGVETKHNSNIPRNYYLTPDEECSITIYAIENPLKGYRALCYE